MLTHKKFLNKALAIREEDGSHKDHKDIDIKSAFRAIHACIDGSFIMRMAND